jgi:oligopeptide/dipeptide ABC transporter ATP-binding protein
MAALLEIADLHVQYRGASPDRPVRAVDGISLTLEKGECYALVGESGCGKSATALAVLRLVDPGRITAGKLIWEGRDLMGLSERELRKIRGAEIGMVFQESAAALNPVMKIGTQVAESLRIHRGLGRAAVREEVLRLLQMVALPDPAQQMEAYPHELSGGMKQRVMLAIALSCSPTLLIADEPTTALDVTIQAQILALLRRLREELDLTILLITHDLGVVAENADRVGVMYAGKLVEEASLTKLFTDPCHPYTRGLLNSLPGRADRAAGRRLNTLAGGVPDPANPPTGCRFHPRCAERLDRCAQDIPMDTPDDDGGRVACLLYSSPPSGSV